MTDKPACGGTCNGCHDCPDLVGNAYHLGVQEGTRRAQAREQQDKMALAAHWEDQTQAPGERR